MPDAIRNKVKGVYLIVLYFLLLVFLSFVATGVWNFYLYNQGQEDIHFVINESKIAHLILPNNSLLTTYSLNIKNLNGEKNIILRIIENEIKYWNFNNPSQEDITEKAFLIYKYSLKYNVDPLLMTAIGIIESNLRRSPPNSYAGAVGLFQIMPSTARGLSYDIYTLEGNVAAAAEFMARLIDRYNSSIEKAVAHYNGGSNPMYKAKHYPETRNYLYNVSNIYEVLSERKAKLAVKSVLVLD